MGAYQLAKFQFQSRGEIKSNITTTNQNKETPDKSDLTQ